MMKKTAMVALVLAVLGVAGVAHATTTASATFQTPVHFQTSMTTSGCDNSHGPQVTLQGAMSLGGVGVQLLFENNLAGTHTFTVESTATATVIPAGQTVTIPKQPVLGHPVRRQPQQPPVKRDLPRTLRSRPLQHIS